MPKVRTSSALELLLPLDPDAPDPLHRQLEHGLRAAIRDGRLAAGTRLPSTRVLAAQLGISRGIVVEAYEQLVAESYLAARPGGTTRVARGAGRGSSASTDLAPVAYPFDFRPGRPEIGEFPRIAWLRSLRRVLNSVPADRLGYLDGHGMPELRVALADYLNRARGTAANPADIVVTTGFAQALGLIGRVLHDRGARRIAVEDPSDPEYRSAIRNAGLTPVGVPVDGAGIVVERLTRVRADAAVVTAAHQYPTGSVMSPVRRAALVDWAERRDARIVEDDYDAEFRYDREPVGAIQGLSPDRVLYTGTASKVLAPGLRLGWIVAPPGLAADLATAKQRADMGSAALDQLAFADFLEHGELDHHLRHMRPIYRRRRDALLAALAVHLPDLRPAGAAAGLHVLAWLPDGVDELALVERAADAGIAIGALSARRIAPGPGGLIFGYGMIAEGAIEPGVERLATIMAALPGR
jgi:GntR family transcriptional regulator / MocR family aminotransferase